jgi:hypothetical protein
VDPGDTGDQRSYGDAGVVADDLSGLVVVDMLAYVLDPLQPNVGQQFLAYYDEPLDVTAIRQHYPPSGPMWHVYLPLVSKEQ